MKAVKGLVFALHFEFEEAVIGFALVFPFGDLGEVLGVCLLQLFLLGFEVYLLFLHLVC